MEQTTITGNLPNMTIEINHRSDPDGGAELMTIHLRATPDFQSALPLLGGLGQMTPLLGGLGQMTPLFAPMTLWTQMLEAWAAPWRQMATANPLLQLMRENDTGK
ncbi:hypothetical protein [Magnetospirillum sulfuroxidans]|uniref:Uncharacterized protein n=1 Tax=Magnetospirillum sulfuroxidans TaxID=611300 RepID=A0ABS5I8H3_9PROT|nr:hypothetical protein [Magnetospirillum sulfuroxidans]MBR9970739.1 hypothetical protein [Magnetospirillum sulfuroxidans]